ncbi:hypothetical protein ILYODFUR_011332 [Ilyodon furcidens]|uniref:Uncharacterized protein n=1 Tax=Ilyodon furcidens TaxID=33524 RepID=A0ABV0VD47_9TELE
MFSTLSKFIHQLTFVHPLPMYFFLTPVADGIDSWTFILLALWCFPAPSASLFTFTYYGPLYFAVWSPLSCTCTVAMMLCYLLNCAKLLSLLVYLLRLPLLLYHHL